MECRISLSPVSQSMASFALKNAIFLIQKSLGVPITKTHVSVSLRVSSSSSSSHPPLESPSKSFTVEYLVNSCGLPLQSAIKVSRLVNIKEENSQRHDAVLELLKSCGLDDAEIALVVERNPKLLTSFNMEEILKPKVDFLTQNGFDGPRLRELIAKNPYILSRSLSDYIKPTLDFLKSILGTEERVWLAVKRNRRLMSNDLSKTLQPIIDILVKEGVAMEDIANFVVTHPHRMQPTVDRLLCGLGAVKNELGMDPSDRMFLLAVMTMTSVGTSLWKKKMGVFESFGFSRDDVLLIFKRYPYCFSRSEEMLRAKLDFYLNTVKLRRDALMSYPPLLSRSIDSRARARHNVLKVLLSKKLLKENTKLARLFNMGEKEFLEKYVMENLQQVQDLMEMYINDTNNESCIGGLMNH